MTFEKLTIFLIILTVFLAGCIGQPATETPPTPPTPAPTPTPAESPTPTPQPTSEPTPAPPSSVKEFKITIEHSGGYSPAKISVSKGDTVKILAISVQTTHKHGIAIDAYNLNKAVLKTSFSDPDVIEFTADKEGSFDIYCKTCTDSDGWGPHPWMKGILEVS